MRSLFIKLFLCFWLTALLSGAIFFLLAMHFRPDHRRLPLQRPQAVLNLPSDAQLQGPPPPPRPASPPPPWHFLEGMGVHLGIFALVGGIICYLLAWRITAPVRRLRQVVQKLAEGDLTVRTGLTNDRRGDEIVDLGLDFDRMAGRIEALVLAQKQLVRDISHELRSPLARLQVALSLARRQSSIASETFLDRIEQEAERLNALIGELLTLSLLENGAGMAAVYPLDLRELLDEVVQDATFEAVASGRKVRLEAAWALVAGNRELLRRAIENVVRNALHYTAVESDVVVQLVEEGRQALIRVADQGPGVPDAMLTAIFQPFYRVAEARDRQSGGTGIGLAITARAIALHGGTVAACNRPEGGLQVEIRLPLADESAVRPASNGA